MYSDAALFLSACNNLEYAKKIINDCKRIVREEIDMPDDNTFSSCKNNIINCGIDNLVKKVENTKKSLLEVDKSFADQYFTILQDKMSNLNEYVSKLSDEEKMQYNVEMDALSREYNTCLLYMLEEAEANGMLTPESAMLLEMQRIKFQTYELQDKMSTLDRTTQEYIDLFKEKAELDKKLIDLDPDMTLEDKEAKKKEYDIQLKKSVEILELNRDIEKIKDYIESEKLTPDKTEYYEKQKEIVQLQISFYEKKENRTDDEDKILSDLYKYSQLYSLSADKIELGNDWVPFNGHSLDDEIFTLKKEMGIATDAELEYLELNGFERALQHTGTFVASTIEGASNVLEGIVDGGAMLVGGAFSLFGWDAGTSAVQSFVATDFTSEAYRGLTLATGMNEVIAYGTAHEAGNFVGEMTAIIGLQFVPGGIAVMTTLHGLKGMGSASEKAFAKGASFNDAFFYGLASGAIDAASAFVLYGKFKSGKKVIDVFGKKGLNVNFGSKGFQNYVSSVIKPSLGIKFAISGLKETGKELSGMIIGEEFNTDELLTNIWQAMVTTAVNEFVVSPLADKATNKSQHSKNVNDAKSTQKKYEKVKARREKQIEKYKNDYSKENQSIFDDTLKDTGYTSVGNSTRLQNLYKSIDNATKKIAHAYDNVTYWDRLVDNGFVNKFIKKISSEYMTESVYN